MLASHSFWHSYLEMLPEIDDIGASFTWKDEDLELLSGGSKKTHLLENKYGEILVCFIGKYDIHVFKCM